MRVEQLEIENFRNFQYAKVSEFDAEMNVICGNNAQGKTNLLEAIYYLCSARSFRTRNDLEVIRTGSDKTTINANVVTGESDDYFSEVEPRKHGVSITFGKNSKKRVELNGTKLKTFTVLPFCTVLFSPEDLELARGGASLRRKWLDTAISQLRPKYAETLSEFRKLYESKTKILKENKPDLLETLDVFNIQLAKAGAVLIYYRAMFCEKLSPIAAETHLKLGGANEKLEMNYKTVSGIENPEQMKPSEICIKLLEHQAEHREIEINSGMCLSGAHKDDVVLRINEQPSEYWSQGQTRTVALSLKFAEREFIRVDTGEYPLLLLDDVLSELDSARRKVVLSRVNGGQTFITCCDIGELQRGKLKGKLIPITDGTVGD
ncbi:MAG: DNA replication/repair protein RecF [Oscillospiraceae bacterium]|jgi:DNA replication and repair protein RecF|nr:DNA replication/repair protein RecF [Oscillospiraceae bacterium]